MLHIKTTRLILRPWKPSDLEAFVALNADPCVMEYFPATKSKQETIEELNNIMEHFAKYKWGLWAVSLIKGADFIGFIGLRHDTFEAPFTPAVEIGWRLAFDAWGKGYATEGALASLKYGFEQLNLPEIISFTTIKNQRSRRIMEKIGMQYDAKDDFDNPKLPQGHPLRPHILYRLKKEQWIANQLAINCSFYTE